MKLEYPEKTTDLPKVTDKLLNGETLASLFNCGAVVVEIVW
jgi:hypothetical protein